MNTLKGIAYASGLIAITVMLGCSTPKSDPIYQEVPGASTAQPSAASTPPAAAPEVKPEAKPAPAEASTEAQQSSESKPELIVTPDNTLTGSVVSVNDVGRFVVMRFPQGRVPAVGTRLFDYRQGLRVAELTVTGPQKDDHTIADIRTGDCRVGDEVRDR